MFQQNYKQGAPNWLKEEADVRYIYSVLDKYRHLDFVKRIYDPSDRIEMPSGRSGTHYMAHSPLYGQYVVYPRIIRNKEGELEILGETEALSHARNTGELIPFSNRTEAEWFSYHYKDIWKGKHQPDGKSLRKHGKINQ